MGRVVIGGDTGSVAHGFESQHCILSRIEMFSKISSSVAGGPNTLVVPLFVFLPSKSALPR